MPPRTPDAISFGWSEGRYLDRWMLVHFLAGMGGGLSNVYFELPRWGVFAAGLGLMVLWELLEVVRDIGESLSNRVIDVVVGMAGTWLAVVLAERWDTATEWVAFVVVSALGVGGSIAGWLAYRRRLKSGG